MDFQINIDGETIRNEAIKTATDRCRKVASSLIDGYFKDGRYTHPVNPGIGYMIIQKTIDDYLMSDALQEAITRIIKERFEDQLSAAVDQALLRKSRKIASQMTGADNP